MRTFPKMVLNFKLQTEKLLFYVILLNSQLASRGKLERARKNNLKSPLVINDVSLISKTNSDLDFLRSLASYKETLLIYIILLASPLVSRGSVLKDVKGKKIT